MPVTLPVTTVSLVLFKEIQVIHLKYDITWMMKLENQM